MIEKKRMNVPTEGCMENWIPTKTQCLGCHDINIEFLSIGCVVKVGCMSFPFKYVNDAIDAIKAYTENPHGERKRWEKLVEEQNN
jgi:hypothetical protein